MNELVGKDAKPIVSNDITLKDEIKKELIETQNNLRLYHEIISSCVIGDESNACSTLEDIAAGLNNTSTTTTTTTTTTTALAVAAVAAAAAASVTTTTTSNNNVSIIGNSVVGGVNNISSGVSNDSDYKITIRAKQRHIYESPEARARRLARNAERMRERRANETEDEYKIRLAKNAEANRIRRQNENDMERAMRHVTDAARQRLRRAMESPEERSKRLTKLAERMRAIRAKETPEQRSRRLLKSAQRARERLSKQSNSTTTSNINMQQQQQQQQPQQQQPQQSTDPKIGINFLLNTQNIGNIGNVNINSNINSNRDLQTPHKIKDSDRKALLVNYQVLSPDQTNGFHTPNNSQSSSTSSSSITAPNPSHLPSHPNYPTHPFFKTSYFPDLPPYLAPNQPNYYGNISNFMPTNAPSLQQLQTSPTHITVPVPPITLQQSSAITTTTIIPPQQQPPPPPLQPTNPSSSTALASRPFLQSMQIPRNTFQVQPIYYPQPPTPQQQFHQPTAAHQQQPQPFHHIDAIPRIRGRPVKILPSNDYRSIAPELRNEAERQQKIHNLLEEQINIMLSTPKQSRGRPNTGKETDFHRVERLRKMAASRRNQRANESLDERQARLKDLADRARKRREITLATENDNERKERLSKQAKYARQRRLQTQTPEAIKRAEIKAKTLYAKIHKTGCANINSNNNNNNNNSNSTIDFLHTENNQKIHQQHRRQHHHHHR